MFVSLAMTDENTTYFRRPRGPRKYRSYFRGQAYENMYWPTKISQIFVGPRDRRKFGLFSWANTYVRRPAHENKKDIFVGPEADENNLYFRRSQLDRRT